MSKMYKSKEESPKEINVSKYWNNGGYASYLREGLPYDHQENLYYWFTREYSDLNPEYYDIYKPEKLIAPEKR